ncbi:MULTISPECIES: VOC family protein [unclassified Blastococcus]
MTPPLGGVDHLGLSVTDLDVGERFSYDVLGFVPRVDFGDVRVVLHRPTGLTLGPVRHGDGGGRFSERVTGLDHLGPAVGSRAELVSWQARLEAAGVEHTPVRDMAFGSHLNLRDPDGIAGEQLAAAGEPVAVR